MSYYFKMLDFERQLEWALEDVEKLQDKVEELEAALGRGEEAEHVLVEMWAWLKSFAPDAAKRFAACMPSLEMFVEVPS